MSAGKPPATKSDNKTINGNNTKKFKPNRTQKKVTKLKGSIKFTGNKCIQLTEDIFGMLVDEFGKRNEVKRYTWRNQNNIRIQVITYGARITSIKLPSNKGVSEDIVLGFDDLAGYLYYKNLYFGATLGRFDGTIRNIYKLNRKEYCLCENNRGQHTNGFDKVNWNPHVNGNKLILSYLSQEGYSGNLITIITFEMIQNDQFSIDIKAMSSKPTIINITNLTYFNLAGHWAGPKALYEHELTINSSSYTPLKEGFSTGNIVNVTGTNYDFRVPKKLKTLIGTNPGDGLDVNLCVNRDANIGNCFVARVLHKKTGRILEIYGNQHGVNIAAANDFGSGLVDIPISLPHELSATAISAHPTEVSSILSLLNRLHDSMTGTLTLDKDSDYAELRDLIRKLENRKFSSLIAEVASVLEDNTVANCFEEISSLVLAETPESLPAGMLLNPLQLTYLENMRDVIEGTQNSTDYSEIDKIICAIIENSTTKDRLVFPTFSSSKGETHNCIHRQLRQLSVQKEKKKQDLEESERKRRCLILTKNEVPCIYKDGRIHGKLGAIYKRHGAMVLKTQNFPDAFNYEGFPSCALRPGEIYHHSIVYRFWIKASTTTS